MRRLFWILVGVGITVVVLRKVNQANRFASQFTPQGISDSVSEVGSSVRKFGQDFKEAMAEHEERLTQALLAEPTEDPNEHIDGEEDSDEIF